MTKNVEEIPKEKSDEPVDYAEYKAKVFDSGEEATNWAYAEIDRLHKMVGKEPFGKDDTLYIGNLLRVRSYQLDGVNPVEIWIRGVGPGTEQTWHVVSVYTNL